MQRNTVPVLADEGLKVAVSNDSKVFHLRLYSLVFFTHLFVDLIEQPGSDIWRNE